MDDNALNKTGIHRFLLTDIHTHIHTQKKSSFFSRMPTYKCRTNDRNENYQWAIIREVPDSRNINEGQR